MSGSQPMPSGSDKSGKSPTAGTPKTDQTLPPGPLVTGDMSKPLCLKKLIGEDVKDGKGENIGEVKDLAVDLGRSDVAYVVVSTGGTLGVGAKLSGVPLNSFKRSDDGKALVIAMSADTLKSGVNVDLDHLPMTPSVPGTSAGTH